jgi:inner membrane protein
MNALETGYITENLMPKEGKLNFSFNIEYKGSKQLRMIPIGEETNLNVKSNWVDPSFVGAYLPYNPDKLSDAGFDAKWKVLNINRAFPQSFFGSLPDLSEFAFGVELKLLANEYQQSTRSAKYGYLVIALTFLVFFLFQTISKVEIHPFQYLMIGIALTMFYTLLISISEHSNFSMAYLISSVSVVTLITVYSKSILKTLKFTAFIASSLIALYVFIYVIIQMENYALVTGSIGLFVILAMVMFASKKIDWSRQINTDERD